VKCCKCGLSMIRIDVDNNLKEMCVCARDKFCLTFGDNLIRIVL